MTVPYKNFSRDKFWRTAIVEKSVDSIFENLWKPKFSIDKSTKIITAGSCFAQHVGRWFSQNGYMFLPSKVSVEHNFSFGIGNIYTAAQLLQWIRAATGDLDLSKVYEKDVVDGVVKYLDPLSPSVKPEGFFSLDELLDYRKQIFEEIITAIGSSDVFVFTFGLTETWHHVNGIVYPVCPGTISGVFDENIHQFNNITYEENVESFEKVIALVKQINPCMKFLLTVSPVPLTATASGQHVLPATILSKSILRNCADYFRKHYEEIDYFPSYELIASHPVQGSFFEANKRSVTSEGVSFVMKHFEAAIASSAYVSTPPPVDGDINDMQQVSNENVLCDEILLDSFNKAFQQVKKPRFCLVGDCHIGRISTSFDQMGVEHIGGIVMAGYAWGEQKFVHDEEEYFVPLDGPESRELWQRTLQGLRVCETSGHSMPILVTNIGLHTRLNVNVMIGWLKENGKLNDFSLTDIIQFFEEKCARYIALLRKFIEEGFKVLVVSDHPLQRYDDNWRNGEAYFEMYEKVYREIIHSMGGDFLLVREWMNEKNLITEKFLSDKLNEDGTPDYIHASSTYYDAVATKILEITS